ncbi:MAG: DUF1802 family protein [Nitrososphaeraceae archaeon]
MIALKEWAIVCKALEEGKQILLLRKGGIMEFRKGFEVKHNEFLLYPTYEHQSRESVKDEYKIELEKLLCDEENDQKKSSKNAHNINRNIINLFAKVSDVIEISDKSILAKLQNYHIWNDEYVTSRMNYNPSKPLYVLLLRVYKIKEPLVIDIKNEWSGCKSWLNIEIDKKWENFDFKNYSWIHMMNKDKIRDDDIESTNKKALIYPVLNEDRFNEINNDIKEAIFVG